MNGGAVKDERSPETLAILNVRRYEWFDFPEVVNRIVSNALLDELGPALLLPSWDGRSCLARSYFSAHGQSSRLEYRI